jgi:hypothetical protein
MVSSAIRCTQGVYPAELQAIARALAMLPASAANRIHSDSRSSLEAVHAYEQQLNERPILQLNPRLMQQREVAGGSVVLSHVKAHIDGDDRHSVGDRIADYHANLARCRLDRSYPLNLRELPLAEHHCRGRHAAAGRRRCTTIGARRAPRSSAGPLAELDRTRRTCLSRHDRAWSHHDDARHSSSAGYLRPYRDEFDAVSLADRCVRRLVIAAVASRSVPRNDKPHTPCDMPGDEQRLLATRAQRCHRRHPQLISLVASMNANASSSASHGPLRRHCACIT